MALPNTLLSFKLTFPLRYIYVSFPLSTCMVSCTIMHVDACSLDLRWFTAIYYDRYVWWSMSYYAYNDLFIDVFGWYVLERSNANNMTPPSGQNWFNVSNQIHGNAEINISKCLFWWAGSGLTMNHDSKTN